MRSNKDSKLSNEDAPNPNPAPQMTPYGKHLLLCRGRFCDPHGRAEKLYASLPAWLGHLGHYQNPKRVKRGMVDCLGVCTGGPLMVVYPEGIWYHHVDEPLLKRIIKAHLEEGCPVESAIFHQQEQPSDLDDPEP